MSESIDEKYEESDGYQSGGSERKVGTRHSTFRSKYMVSDGEESGSPSDQSAESDYTKAQIKAHAILGGTLHLLYTCKRPFNILMSP